MQIDDTLQLADILDMLLAVELLQKAQLRAIPFLIKKTVYSITILSDRIAKPDASTSLLAFGAEILDSKCDYMQYMV
jgi:hypothetical protein